MIRSGHVSWLSPSGLILMGPDKTSEKIQEDGTSIREGLNK